MNMRLDTVLTTALVICAFVTSGVVVKKELFSSSQLARPSDPKTALVPNWRDYLATGERLGPPAAKVRLIEFADFECPYCASVHRVLTTILARYPGEVSLEYVHFPLPTHRFAVVAARAAECASAQDRFEAMYDQLFGGQDSFGLKPWTDYATAARVPDLAAFDACVKKTDPVVRIEEGKKLGAKLNIQATPTLIVNGWKLTRPPNIEELDTMVKAVLAGKDPVSGRT
jgi:protein-disulfide isomerase